MKKQNLWMTVICLLFLGQKSFAQPFEMGLHGMYIAGTLYHVDYQHYSIETTPSGEYVLAGAIHDPFAGGVNTDIHLVKLDATGNLLWSRRINYDADDAALDVMVEPGGDIVLTGYISPGPNLPKMYIAKYSATGGFIADKIIESFPADASAGTNIIRSSSGNYIIGGFYAESPVTYPLNDGQAVLIELNSTTLNVVSSAYISRTGSPESHTSINDIIEIPGTGYFATGSYEKTNGTTGTLAVIVDGSLNLVNDLSFYYHANFDDRGVTAYYDAGLDEIFLVSNSNLTGNPQIHRISSASGGATITDDRDITFFDQTFSPINDGSAFQLIECPWDATKLVLAGRFRYGPVGSGVDNNNWLVEIDKAAPWTLAWSSGMVWDLPSPNYAGFGPTSMGPLFSTFVGAHPYIYNEEILTNRIDNDGIVNVTPSQMLGTSYGIDVVSSNGMSALGCYEEIWGQLPSAGHTGDPLVVSSGSPIAEDIGLIIKNYIPGQDWDCLDPTLPRRPIEMDDTQDGTGVDFATTSLDDQGDIAVTVAPNPSAGQFRITFSGDVLDGNFQIINAVGQVVYKSERINGSNYTTTVDLSNYENGVYLLQFADGRTQFVQKLMKH